MDINEAGGNHLAVRIDSARASAGGKVADLRDLSSANADIARIPGRARPVDNAPIGDNDVEGNGLGGCVGHDQQGQKKRQQDGSSPRRYGLLHEVSPSCSRNSGDRAPRLRARR